MSEALALPLDRAGIEAIIPHREPFLLVDEIVELVAGERAVGRYHVDPDAWYLRGHFPGRPIMPRSRCRLFTATEAAVAWCDW